VKIRRKIAAITVAVLVGTGLSVAVSSPAFADNWTGPFQIRPSAAYGKCLDITGVSQSNGALVQLYDCLPNQWNQQFYLFEPISSLPHVKQIVPRHSWKCLDVMGASQSDGAYIQQFDCLGISQNNQLFVKTVVGVGFVQFSAAHSGRCLNYTGTSNGSNVIQGSLQCQNMPWFVLEPV